MKTHSNPLATGKVRVKGHLSEPLKPQLVTDSVGEAVGKPGHSYTEEVKCKLFQL